MASLIARSALAGHAPLTLCGLRLAEGHPGPITSLARLQDRPLDALLAAAGLSFPAPNTMVSTDTHRLVWTGRDQAFLFGPPPEGLAGACAATDQSDGWATLLLEGRAADQVLSRLVPLDLRLTQFPQGRVARAPLNHMQAILMRSGAESFAVMVFRSMAKTAWHEIETAMRAVAARAALG